VLELLGLFVLALLPIVWLVIALCGLHLEAYKAAIGAFAVAAVEALIIWGMSPLNVATAALEGVEMALWPIGIVIVAAVFTYNVTVHSGAMDVIKRMICSVSSDRRVLVLLVGWCFGAFLEGMAGFGTAVAIPASMLVALGFEPVCAILACLIANGTPTMFGSIGIPTTTLASITGLDPTQLALTQSLQVLPFVIVCPFLMVMLVGGGRKALKGMVPTILVSALAFAIPEIATAAFIGAELPVIVASVCSLVATFAFSLARKDAPVPDEYRLGIEEGDAITPASALRAWAPFILIFVVLLLTSKLVPAIHDPLSSISSKVNVYQGDPSATLTFTWVDTPGVLILLCGVAGALIQHVSPRETAGVMVATLRQMSKTILTMLGVLACAKVMGYSGMIGSIAAFFVGTLGGLYPLVAPLLGALGTFVTGSGTSSEVLFGNVQIQAARSIGANEYWLAAANSLGTSAGKMLAPQSIAIGTAACGANGRDGEVLGRIFRYFVGFVIAMAALVFIGSVLGL
jgi:lactate permease